MAADSSKLGVDEYENSDLRRKLQSKTEALFILSKELDQSRTERDQFKLMAEQLQDRYSVLKKKMHDMGFTKLSLYSDGFEQRPGTSVVQILGETKEINKALKIEVEDLREKLRDAQGDMKALRARFTNQRSSSVSDDNQPFPTHQREELIQQLESLNFKYTQMASDLQSVLDEKQDLVTERESYKCKVHRLNHELNTLLKGDANKLVDIDALVMENRYYQERLHQVEEEKEMAHQALVKYKSMLEKKRSKGSLKFGTNDNSAKVMTHKQVQQLLGCGTSTQLPNTPATLSDMKSLCMAILDRLENKSLALAHQKKANRILANRISDLEHRLAAVEGGVVAAYPSQLLLQGYGSSDVDRDVERILAEDEVADVNREMSSTAAKQDAYVAREGSSPGSASGSAKVDDSSSVMMGHVLVESQPVDSQDGWNEDDLPPELRLMMELALKEIKVANNIK